MSVHPVVIACRSRAAATHLLERLRVPYPTVAADGGHRLLVRVRAHSYDDALDQLRADVHRYIDREVLEPDDYYVRPRPARRRGQARRGRHND